MRKIRIKICLLAAMLAVATGIQASDFVVDELCYNITDAEAKTVEVAKYDYAVDGEMVRPTKMDVAADSCKPQRQSDLPRHGARRWSVHRLWLEGWLVRLHVDSSSGGFA